MLSVLIFSSTKILTSDDSKHIYQNSQPLLYQSSNNDGAKFAHKNSEQLHNDHQDLPIKTGDGDIQAQNESSECLSVNSQVPSKSSRCLRNSTSSQTSKSLSMSSQVPKFLIKSSQAPKLLIESSQASSENNQLALLLGKDHESVHQNHQRALTGFALCTSYWEQQTNSLLNMWSFQKWANQSGNLSVVEPFASISVLGLPSEILYDLDFANALRFSDYYDLEYWTKETAKYGIPPMVTWDTFIRYANRKIVVVILVYEVPFGGVYINDDLKKHRECNLELKRFYNFIKTLVDRFHFEVIKTVCFASYPVKWQKYYPTLKIFNSYLYSDQSNLTYWFSVWRGVQSDRITINHKTLERAYDGEENVLAMGRTSPRIIEDSKRYVKTVLKVYSNEYTAVAFRTQSRKIIMVSQGYSRDTILAYFLKCASDISLVLKGLKTNQSLLCIDLGRFGDLTSGSYYDYDSNNTFDGKGTKVLQTALNTVYGNKTIDEYHNDFIRAANGIEDSGYIGAMQKTIAENAKCLVVIGGSSSFQRSMILHHNSTSACVKYLCYSD